jgi:hypothetical protein
MNQRQLEHAIRQARRALNELEQRAPAVLERDHRGGTNERDGYPTSTIGGAHQPFTVDSTSSTAAAAEDRITHGNNRHDDIHRSTRALTEHLDRGVRHLIDAVSQVALAEHLANPDGRHTNPPTHCTACDRLVMCTSEDPIRSGYCDACRKAWERAGRPDRPTFERQRRQRGDAA